MNAMPFHQQSHSRREVLRLEALALLKDFAADLIGIEDIDALLWAVAERTISKLGWVDCVIYLKDPHRDILVQKAAFGPKSIDYKAIFEPIEVPMGRGVVGKVASTGQALRIGNTSQFKDYIEDDAVRLSELAVPILWGKEVLGVIDSEHPEQEFYLDEDQLILETIAGITATKIQQARSTHANSELALFYERNPNPVLQLDEELEISFINQSAKDCFPENLDVGNRLERPRLREALQTAKKKGRSTWRCHQTDPLSGKERTGEFNIVHLDAGQFNLYGSDISHILQLQKAAEAANEAKSKFLSVMSHEIRTPLNAILGLTDLLIHEHPSRDEQLRHLAYMEFSGRHLLSLVNDILDLEKLASGKATSVKTSFDLVQLVDSIIDSFRNRADKVGLQLTHTLAPGVPPHVQTDIKWLTQILNNLLGNAIKYTEQGSVHLDVHILASGGSGEGEVPVMRFSVIDTGRGIPASEQERIIQPFEQIRTDPSIEGTGLGLAIVNSLIKRLGGTMTIESKVNEGSSFHVDLPIATVDATPSEPESRALDSASPPSSEPNVGHTEPLPDKAESKASSCPILLADDNDLNRFVASKLLMRWGYEVHEATDGTEAVEIWQSLGPCLILMDVQMPKMDGIEATEHIRREENRRNLTPSPIIALTADAEDKTYRRILACGMDERIVKPFDPPTLKALIERIISSAAVGQD